MVACQIQKVVFFPMADAGTVEIRRLGKGFAVNCVPPDPAYPPETFTDKRHAFGYAGGISLVTGRRKIDLTGSGGDGKS